MFVLTYHNIVVARYDLLVKEIFNTAKQCNNRIQLLKKQQNKFQKYKDFKIYACVLKYEKLEDEE